MAKNYSVYKERRKANGPVQWVADVRLPDAKFKRRFLSQKEAEDFAQGEVVAHREGRAIVRRKSLTRGRAHVTLQALYEAYCVQVKFETLSRDTQDYEDCIKIRRVAADLTGPIKDITAGQIYKTITAYTNPRTGKPLKPSTIGKYFDSCAKLIRLAQGLDWFNDWEGNRFEVAKDAALSQGDVQPSAERERGDGEVPRIKFLESYVYQGDHPDYKGKVFKGVSELDMMHLECEVAAPWLSPIMQFSYLSSMRMSHCWRLEWEHITFLDDLVIVRRKRKEKNLERLRESSKWEEAPLEQGAGDFLRELAEKHREKYGELTGPVFPDRDGTCENTGKKFVEIADRLGFYDDGLTFHVLRHEAISRFHEEDYPTEAIMLFSGHRSEVSLRRYTHLRPETKANRWRDKGVIRKN